MTADSGLSLHESREEPVVEAQGREITVLVTGYGPFLEKFPVNVSWSIASTLPRYIPPTAALPYPIRIIIPDKPLRVSYAAVASITPKLLSGTYSPSDSPDFLPASYKDEIRANQSPSSINSSNSSNSTPPTTTTTTTTTTAAAAAAGTLPKPDLILHIGLAAGRNFYTLERQSPRGPFNQFADVDGQIFPSAEAERLFGGCPSVLKPTFDTDDVWRRWRTNVRDITADLRPSDDPGRYLCGFIYYLSMAWFMKRTVEFEGERPVLFLHVPDLPSEAKVAQGREVAVGLIKAMVGSRLKLGVVDPLKPEDLVVDTKKTFAWSGVDDLKS